MLERSFFSSNFGRSQVRFTRYEAVQFIEKFQRFHGTVTDSQLDEQLRQSHRPESNPALSLLVLLVLLEMVWSRIDHIVQEANGVANDFFQFLPVHVMIGLIEELRQVDRGQVTYSPCRQPLFTARIRTDN